MGNFSNDPVVCLVTAPIWKIIQVTRQRSISVACYLGSNEFCRWGEYISRRASNKKTTLECSRVAASIDHGIGDARQTPRPSESNKITLH